MRLDTPARCSTQSMVEGSVDAELAMEKAVTSAGPIARKCAIRLTLPKTFEDRRHDQEDLQAQGNDDGHGEFTQGGELLGKVIVAETRHGFGNQTHHTPGQKQHDHEGHLDHDIVDTVEKFTQHTLVLGFGAG